jgi:cysteine synthase
MRRSTPRSRQVEAAGALLISDTARAADEIVPQQAVAGYTTALAEVEQQLSRSGDDRIDAVVVQAGVGGLSSATTIWARLTRRGRSPRVIVVEPEPAVRDGGPCRRRADRGLGQQDIRDGRPAMRDGIGHLLREPQRRSELLPRHRGLLGDPRPCPS